MRALLAVILIGLYVCSAQAAIELPFSDSLPEYKISINKKRNDTKIESEVLRQWLRDELKKVRTSSAVLKSYKDPQDIARYERGTLQKLLRSRGYYSARVNESVIDDVIYYQISPGFIYRIKGITIFMPDHLRQGFSGVGLKVGDPLDAKKVTADISAIKKYLNSKACLLNIDVKYEATIIRDENAAKLIYRVAPSPEVNLGVLRIEGLTTINVGYLRKQLKLSPGDCFNRNKIDAANLRLLQTNLVSVVDNKISPPHNGVVDVTFVLKERKHHTISFGVGFTSDEGLGVAASWEHRNIFHHGEKLEVEAKLNRPKKSLKGEVSFPDFFRDDQRFSTTAEISNEKRDNYKAKAVTVGGTISRRLSKHRIASVGSELKFSRIEEKASSDEYNSEEYNITENFQLLSFPLGLKIDTTDKLLDARRGTTTAMEIKPYLNLTKGGMNFVKNTLVLTGYLTASKVRYTPTLAVRAKIGWMFGVNSNLDIPVDERFYAGGGGSVRGYGYQTLGPRGVSSDQNETVGGRGLSELSFEGRFRFTETWGGVIFLDGGNTYAKPKPRFGSTLFWGAGIGVRYITSFAPLRFDLAVPLERRDGFDDRDVHIYVSLGQAF